MYRHRPHPGLSSSAPDAGAVGLEGDPVNNHPQGVGLALEAMPMHALLFQRPDCPFHHPVLLRAVRGGELLPQAVPAHQPGVIAAGEH